MKIYARAYLTENLGDDLFIKILTDRYKKHRFYSISRGFKNYTKGNLKVYSNPILFDIIEEFKLEKYLSNKCDLAISIGGSMYMENEKYIKDYSFGKNKYYVLGSNFGPYKTQEYFQLSKETFKECTDICFRDKASYNLFKELNSVRYSPDVAFLYDVGNLQKEKGTIGISMIDLKVRDDLKDKEGAHTKILIESIKEYIKNGKKVYLFSFCKHEGDEEAISKLLNEIEEKNQKIPEIIGISAKNRQGIQTLEETLKNMFFEGNLSFNDEIYITNVRQKAALQDAKEALLQVLESIRNGMPEDFYSIDLMAAYEALGSITGETIGEDLVNEIFSKFCMGK